MRAILGAKASGNDRGLSVSGIIELSTDVASVFYWVLTVLSVGFVVAAALMAIVRLTLRQRIALTHTSITAPRSRWSREEVVVPFREVAELATSELAGQRFLTMVHNGRKLTVTASMLPAKADFDDICAAVSHGVNAARAHGGQPHGRS